MEVKGEKKAKSISFHYDALDYCSVLAIAHILVKPQRYSLRLGM